MEDLPAFPSSFITPWAQALHDQQSTTIHDFPDYHTSSPINTLVTSCRPRSITTGTGASIFEETLLPAFALARSEIILVTCFWAESQTLTSLRETLENLAVRRASERKAWDTSRKEDPANELRVSLCFSSSGLMQKLLHPQSTLGRTYTPQEWPALGLPSAELLASGGIALTVKSLFFLPFSVMHPKFLLIDRERAWMPSCNVSWESWFETCIEFSGPAVDGLFAFYRATWDAHDAKTASNYPLLSADTDNGRGSDAQSIAAASSQYESFTLGTPAKNRLDFEPSMPCPAIILPSSHHVNPRFRPWWPFGSGPVAPATPLNVALLTLFANAQKHIEIMTPNLTSEPAIQALLDALQRGVDVTVRTSRNMMVVEQLVTAGMTTAWKLRNMIGRYQKMVDRADAWRRSAVGLEGNEEDVERQDWKVGKLEVFYYRANNHASASPSHDEPVLAHAKMVLVDGEYLVLGSGNMDRASWFTSQELGILLYVPGFSPDVWRTPLRSRQDRVFPPEYNV